MAEIREARHGTRQDQDFRLPSYVEEISRCYLPMPSAFPVAVATHVRVCPAVCLRHWAVKLQLTQDPGHTASSRTSSLIQLGNTLHSSLVSAQACFHSLLTYHASAIKIGGPVKSYPRADVASEQDRDFLNDITECQLSSRSFYMFKVSTQPWIIPRCWFSGSGIFIVQVIS